MGLTNTITGKIPRSLYYSSLLSKLRIDYGVSDTDMVLLALMLMNKRSESEVLREFITHLRKKSDKRTLRHTKRK